MKGSNAPTSTARTATVVFMGPTGTGKSTLINLLTNDDKIRIGHDLESQTIDITTSCYTQDGISVTLVDTPGFDDSREGITDTDVLGKIVDFLQENGGQKLNGIIYLHRISDPRVGGTAKKNLKVFREICGDKNLDHVRIVTTNWNLVDEKLGNARQEALAKGAFGPLINEGARLCRHDKDHRVESARMIMSQLINQKPVMMKIQEELNKGRTLGDTSAGAMIIGEMKQLKEKHDKEMEGLMKEMDEAHIANNEELRSELDEERRKLEGVMARAEEDRKTLEKMRKPGGTQRTVAARKSNCKQMRRPSETATESDVPETQGERQNDSDQAIPAARSPVTFGPFRFIGGISVGVWVDRDPIDAVS